MDVLAPNKSGVALKDLLDAGLHFGHQTKRWNPKMKRYIFDKRNGIHIIDLTQTVTLIDEAAEFLRQTVLSGRKILFVATKKQAQEVVREAAEACGQFHMTERWLGGTLTNSQTVRKSVKRMRQIEAMGRNNNGVLSIHKKEAANLRRELDKLQANLGGIAEMNNDPGALVIVDICREANAVKEAVRLGIPIVAIVDTNADPDPIDYVIPGNDDAVRGVKIIMDAFANAVKDASEQWAKAASERRAQQEAEQVSSDAQDRGARQQQQRPRRDRPAGDAKGGDANPATNRRTAAKAAQETIAAAKASVEAAPAVEPVADQVAPVVEHAASAAE